jgi:hypothetical protein
MSELTYAALRQIMYQPSACWLATEFYEGDRWLTDQFVMLKVTGHSALIIPEHADEPCYCDETSTRNCPQHHDAGYEMPDGAYKLTVSNGIQPRDSIPAPDLDAWSLSLKGDWAVARPTEWSVAEHPGKAMLWVSDSGVPCLIGEPTWTAIRRHYPDCRVEYLESRNLFSFSLEDRFPFCYAAGIQIPDGQEETARAIVALTQLATGEAR